MHGEDKLLVRKLVRMLETLHYRCGGRSSVSGSSLRWQSKSVCWDLTNKRNHSVPIYHPISYQRSLRHLGAGSSHEVPLGDRQSHSHVRIHISMQVERASPLVGRDRRTPPVHYETGGLITSPFYRPISNHPGNFGV